MTDQRSSFLARLNPPESAPPWGLPAAALAIVGAFVAMIAVSVFVGTWLGERPATLLIGWTFGGLAVLAFVLQSRRSAPDRAALRLTRTRMVLPLLLALNIAIAMLLDLLSLGVTGQFLPVSELLPLAQQPGEVASWLFAVVFMVIVQPIAEELVFRGVTLPALRATFGGWAGILASAILYGVFHFVVYSPTYPALYPDATRDTALWYGLLLPSLDGLVFSLVRARAGSTRAAIIAHAAFGIFALLKLLYLAR